MILMALTRAEVDACKAARSDWNTAGRVFTATDIPSWLQLEKELSGSFMGEM